jgi:Na+-driven multidrug efflux pump
MIALEFNRVFHISNAMTLILAVPGTWFFIWYLKWGVVGAGIIKGILEVFNSVLYYTAFRRHGQPKSFQGKETWRDAYLSRGFFEYIKFFLKSAYAGYLEYFGIEFITI